MNRFLIGGVTLTVLGVAGYATGAYVVYPGRAFSVTAIMLGITLLSVGVDWGEAQ